MILQKLDTIKKGLFPPYCIMCGEMLCVNEWERSICEDCLKNVDIIGEHICISCKNPLYSGEICPECRNVHYFSRGISVFYYDDVRNGIHDFKFYNLKKHCNAFGIIMGDFIVREYMTLIKTLTCVVPVPMHRKKLKKREFNQAEILGIEVARKIGIVCRVDILQKIKYTTSQTRIDQKDRRDNLTNTFIAQNCAGLTILLVDDVYTSGSTANECSRVLKEAGAKDVIVFTLAITN